MGEICLLVLDILTEKVLGIWALDLDVHDIGIDYLPILREFFILSPPPSRFNLILMVWFFFAVSCFLTVFIMYRFASWNLLSPSITGWARFLWVWAPSYLTAATPISAFVNVTSLSYLYLELRLLCLAASAPKIASRTFSQLWKLSPGSGADSRSKLTCLPL